MQLHTAETALVSTDSPIPVELGGLVWLTEVPQKGHGGGYGEVADTENAGSHR